MVSPADAGQKYKTSYLEFESDILLSCNPTKLRTTLCIAQNKPHRESIIITFAAKRAGKMDNFRAYKDHLKKPQTNKTPKGKKFKSQVNFLKEVTIHGTRWIDALHKGGELENFYTRYFATVHNGVAIVFAVTIDAKKYKSYALWLKKLTSSLKATAIPGDKKRKLQKEKVPKMPSKKDDKKPKPTK